MLQLVDRSLVHLKGVLEDVLVKVWEFIIPINFEEDREIFILLATYKWTIDLEWNKLISKIDDEIEEFKCGCDSQSEGLLRDECYVLFNLTPKNLDQKYFLSCASIGPRNVREQDNWRDFDRNGIDWKAYDGRERRFKSMVKFRELPDN